MRAIGIDTHMAACAVDDLGSELAEETFDNDPAGHSALAAWARAVAGRGGAGLRGLLVVQARGRAGARGGGPRGPGGAPAAVAARADPHPPRRQERPWRRARDRAGHRA